MINKTFHLYWSGGPINYFRYLTFLTLRRHHPDWQILLYTNPKHGHAEWAECSQDFHHEQATDYTGEVYEICNEVIPWEKHQDKAPNFQSDFFRWQVLKEQGGWYLDVDQLILRPFDDWNDNEFVYAAYNGYFPVGVLGSVARHSFNYIMLEQIENTFNPLVYNRSGPDACREALKSYIVPPKMVNSGNAFYPIGFSKQVFMAYREGAYCNTDAYAMHLFGAHPDSQEYAKILTPEVAKTRNDWICRHLRENDYV